MTLRDLINKVTCNAPLTNYLSNFKELDYEFSILHNSLVNINMPFEIEDIKIDRIHNKILFMVE